VDKIPDDGEQKKNEWRQCGGDTGLSERISSATDNCHPRNPDGSVTVQPIIIVDGAPR